MRRVNIEKFIPLIANFARANNLKYVGLFGSEARGDAREDSDVDVMIKFNKPVGMFAFVGMQEELSKIFQATVDLQTQKSINYKIKPYIEKDLITLYEE